MFETTHIHFSTIPSTNTWAKEHSKEWANEKLTLITASEQTGGRGRFKRQWVSPPDVNIYATFCFLIDDSRQDIGHIPQLLALTAAEILTQLGFQPKLKWPNDILLNGKKVGGILCESLAIGPKRGLIVGIGLNINMPLEELEKIDRPATSLYATSGQRFSVSDIIATLLRDFNKNLCQFLKKDFLPFWPEFLSLSYFKKGDSVQFHDNQHLIKGIFNTLLPDGSVSLTLETGTKIFHVGEFIQ
jgi:BirA family biotin operon repressor/biotin-[acetyl-CoA-carboxylase] ligase